MGFVNKVMLMGNLTRDPELRQLPSGSAVCDFTIATNRVYKTAAGEEKQETVFADCTAFGRTGEVIAEYCVQGRPLFVEGRLHYETWEDKAGNRRSKLSVIVESFQFVGSREGGEAAQRSLPLKAEPKRVAEKSEAARGENRGAARRAGADRFEKGQRPAEAGRKAVRQAAAKSAETADDENVEDADLPF
ncbi:MAG TPA: single-stranded DNA-binding protein [Phycisphaerae bacterium]|jgi:single-strand DNA-binding protein|nr:single-stranded DNA-binding protein [Phycisphaerae bacterium]